MSKPYVMWSDAYLADVLRWACIIESHARRAWQDAGDNLAERDAALVLVRNITGTRKALETWISTRALRNRLQSVNKE